MGRGYTTASVIFLIGSSTAGKTTICEEVLAQNARQPVDKRFNWHIDGDDAAWERFFSGPRNPLDEHFFTQLKDDPRFLLIQRMHPEYKTDKSLADARDIYGAIINGDFKEVPLLDDKLFEEKVGAFVEKNPQYSREMMENLRSLAKQHNQAFSAHITEFDKANDEKMFLEIIANSKAGRPVIFDSVRPEIATRFAEFCDRQNFTCPVHVALAHLPVAELVDRMDQRNAAAAADGGNKNNERKGMFPFNQYRNFFGAAKDGERVVGEVTRADVQKAAKFGTPSDADYLAQKIGLDDSRESTKLAARVYHDGLYQTSSAQSSADIAKKIISLTTDASITRNPVRASWQERVGVMAKAMSKGDGRQ